MDAPKVFISYSHDSREHSDRVLALAQQLRLDGIDTELDQFHQCELVQWPRWCEEQMWPESSRFVLAVCTSEYRRRIEGRVAADVGQGVFWEGTLIYNHLYDAKDNRRIIPVYFEATDANTIPVVLRGYNRFFLSTMTLDDPDSAYANLYRLLTGQSGIAQAELGQIVRLPAKAEGVRQTDFSELIASLRQEISAVRDESQKHTALLQKAGDRLEDIITAVRQQLVGEPLTPQERYERALNEVAFKHDLTPQDLREAIDHWTAMVKANPLSTPYDLALAEYKCNHFDQAVVQARLAYEQAMHARQQATTEAIKAARLEGDAHYAATHYTLALAGYRKAAELTDRATDPQWWAETHEWVFKPLYAMARYTEAESLMRDIIVVRETHSGYEHTDTAFALSNLGQLLKATDHLVEAEALIRRALAIYEASYGKDHPDVARDLNNLAQLLKETNHLAEAEPLLRRALAIDETCYGMDHPEVAIDLSNLGKLLKDSNRLAEAEPLMRRGLAINEACYGQNDHPTVAVQLHNLAGLLMETNRLAEAEPLLRRALIIDEACFGNDDYRVAITLNSLAKLLADTNRLGKAESLYRHAISILTRSLGWEHSLTMMVSTNWWCAVTRLRWPEKKKKKLLKKILQELGT